MARNSNQGTAGGAVTRRQWIAGASLAVGSMTLKPERMRAAGVEEISRTGEAIHQEVSFAANRQQVYETLTSTEKFDKVVREGGTSSMLGNQPTQIARELGGSFVLFGGHIVGRHLEMVAGERLVQAWRVIDWAPGEFSIIRFVLRADGAGTHLIFDHSSFPKGQAAHLAEGWRLHYWEPMTKVLTRA